METIAYQETSLDQFVPELLDFVGKTPLVKLKKLSPKPGVNIFAKLEGNNPGGSVKDRSAFGMIKGAIESGALKPGMRLIEPTSGNTGIALAMIARLLEVEIELVMPEMASKERIQTIEAYGAKVTLIPKEQPLEEVIIYARDKAAKEGLLMLDQFSNPDNWLAHYQTTGPEIFKETKGKITHFVSSMGTTGTIMGVSRFLKEMNREIQIVGVQPAEEAQIPGIRRWAEDFLPAIYEKERVDRIIDVTQPEALHWTLELVKQEGIFTGPSSGAAIYSALKIADEIDEGNIVCIICDRGDRYLSTQIFGSNT